MRGRGAAVKYLSHSRSLQEGSAKLIPSHSGTRQLGIGGGAFPEVYPIFHAAPVSSEVVWDRAHSTYLALWAELGILGGTLPLLLFGLLGWRSARAYAKEEHKWGPGLAAVACLVVAGLHSSVDFSLEIQANAFYLLAFAGLGAAGET